MSLIIRSINILSIIVICLQPLSGQEKVTLCSLFDEMVNMERLTNLPPGNYRSIQFSSYDRRSTSPYESGWFTNADGFGGEPIPNFEKVLQEPDENGTGVYLICDVQQPGAILRLWTANFKGDLRVYIDDMETAFYEGNAEDFFWKTPEILTGEEFPAGIFRQFDAVYFPIPFSERLRVEWIGNLKETHFYHVQLRVYNEETVVEPFSREAYASCAGRVNEVADILAGRKSPGNQDVEYSETTVPPAGKKVLWQNEGTGAIDYFSILTEAPDMEEALRKTILNIYFDNSSTPQVQAPLGDFFGAAPGVNPFRSHAFSVEPDGTMVCRFIMPYRNNVRIEAVNHSSAGIFLLAGTGTRDYGWEEGKTMHFRARWKIDHDVVASDTEINDYPYLMAIGKGRIVGAATYIYNPSNVPSSWGNWWGEGDEKIFVDDDVFPSFFGTGSEDYYNYSWSSADIFSYPYCGQPRNDGPGNRGYVANFRWHILDDIPFYRNMAFYMELLHHGVVPRTSYGRIVYYYALPVTIDDFQQISMSDIRDLPYYVWSPEPLKGSAGNRFVSAEEHLARRNKNVTIEEGKIWSGGRIVMWEPGEKGEKIRFIINSDEQVDNTRIGFTMAKMPEGGTVSLYLNGQPVRLRGRESVSLYEVYQTVLDNFTSEAVQLKKGKNEIVFENVHDEPGKKIGIDFIWLRQ
jgi:hypothetical protein